MSRRVVRGGDWAEALLRQLPASATSPWLQESGSVLKRESHSLVALAELQGENCYLKYYAAKNSLQGMAFLLGRGRAVNAYDNAVRVAKAGIPVPTPKACLLLDDGMLLATDGMPESQDLKAIWLAEPAPGLRTELLRAAGELLALLHGGGFAHGDCKWSNLLWCQNQFYLVDLEAISVCARGHPKQARDLARFTVNAEDLGVAADEYQLFVDAYCSGTRISREQFMKAMRPDLDRLRSRHHEKYGERGSRLVS